MFNKGNNQSPAPSYQSQYPAYYPPPPASYGNNIDTRAPAPPYQFPQQSNMPMQHPNIPIQHSSPRPWFRITKDEVRNLANDQPIVSILRQSAFGVPSGLSSKSSVSLIRPDGSLLGTVRFHSLTSTDIDFTVNGHSSQLSESVMLDDRFTFKPLSRGAVTTFGASGDKWCWKLKGQNAMLHSAKKGGELLAKIDEGMLVFEKPGMSHAEMDEILVTAVAVFLKAKRNKKDGEAAEGIGEAIGAIAGG